MSDIKLGRVSQVTPLRVQLNGDTADAPAEPLGSFTGAVLTDEVATVTVEGRRLAWLLT